MRRTLISLVACGLLPQSALALVASSNKFGTISGLLRAQAGRTAARPLLQRSQLQMESEDYEPAAAAVSNEGPLGYIFENNRAWVQMETEADPDVFARHNDGQAPKILYIGCSDSRVPAQNMMGLHLGELFVLRNVANVVTNIDVSLLSVVQYAVEVLQVTDIVVCGHTNCGGVKASTQNLDHGLIEHYLLSIRNVQRLHQAELEAIPDEDARFRRLVELNVQESCFNLFANPSVQKKQATASQPRIHGWVYDIGTGLLKDLKIDFSSEIRKYKNIYSLYDFPKQVASFANPMMTSRRG